MVCWRFLWVCGRLISLCVGLVKMCFVVLLLELIFLLGCVVCVVWYFGDCSLRFGCSVLWNLLMV